MVAGSRARRSRSSRKAEFVRARSAPVAQVMVDSALPHLDRVFDYAVPETLDAQVVVGSRVRVRFAGRLTDGFVVARSETGEHTGEVRPIERVIGSEPVLTPATLAVINQVAERYAGTFSDVARAAVPPRHARAEATVVEQCRWQATGDHADRWEAYQHGPALLSRLGSPPGSAPTRAVWSAAPATSWAADLAALARSVLERPVGGVLVVVPDARDVDRCRAEFADVRKAGALATLEAGQGPERRYREFVRVLRGGARLVVGTRAAVFAPVRDLRLIVVWDDGDDALVDAKAPYWDARDVAALRSATEGCDLVVGSPARSAQTQQWCTTGWAHSVVPTKQTLVERAPRVTAISADDAARDEAAAVARIPHRAWRAAQAAVAHGPVLVQVGRRGYLPAFACGRCRTIARCACGGALERLDGQPAPQCAWCGTPAPAWACDECGSKQLRAVAIGAERTAEEIGRAFPGVAVLSSHAGHIIDAVGAAPAIVVATPGAEPVSADGYRAVLILDARAAVQRPYLDAGEDAARRWFAAARLAAPRAAVVVTAANSLPAVQALVRWDPEWLAERELAEREAAGLPPSTRIVALVGASADIDEVVTSVSTPHRVLGPVPDRSALDQFRALLVVDRSDARALAMELREITATRAVRARTRDAKARGARPVHVHVDPRDI